MTCRTVASAFGTAVFLATAPAERLTGASGFETIVVKMVHKSPSEFVFEPANITVRRGDIVRFVQTSTSPHNVEFRDVPEGTELNGSTVGPYLIQMGETYDVVIDARFTTGEHAYVCTPHQFKGMVGMITVED